MSEVAVTRLLDILTGVLSRLQVATARSRGAASLRDI